MVSSSSCVWGCKSTFGSKKMCQARVGAILQCGIHSVSFLLSSRLKMKLYSSSVTGWTDKRPRLMSIISLKSLQDWSSLSGINRFNFRTNLTSTFGQVECYYIDRSNSRRIGQVKISSYHIPLGIRLIGFGVKVRVTFIECSIYSHSAVTHHSTLRSNDLQIMFKNTYNQCILLVQSMKIKYGRSEDIAVVVKVERLQVIQTSAMPAMPGCLQLEW